MVTAAVPGNQFRHLALLYHGHSEYLSVLRAFIQACAARGDAVFVAVPRRKALLVRRELGDDPVPATLADMAELGRNPARIIPAVLSYADQHRGQNVCFIGEPIWPGRTAAEITEATGHEALINLALRDSPVTVMCPYDGARLPKSVPADAACTHPAVIRDRQETASAGYRGPTDLPPRCNRALSPSPAHAEALAYRDDLHPVRSFVASRARRAGFVPLRIPDLVLAISELAASTLRHHQRRRNSPVLADQGQDHLPGVGHRPDYRSAGQAPGPGR